MPGIAGLITKMSREHAVAQFARMTAGLHHESFYTGGSFLVPSSGIYLGWTAHKDSFCDGMPLRNEKEDLALVFSGEEFPEPGTAQRLREQGHACPPEGPDYLVHLAEEGANFPAGLNGRFHGLLVDQRQGQAVLFNDRYGMHRLYCHQAKEAFYFASEAKAILAACPELRRIDLQALGEFIACGSALEGRTLFQGIRLLPPASAWVFENGTLIEKRSYFRPAEWENQQTLKPEEYYRQLREVFTRNLPRYFSGRERIGMSLTGGLDTRMVMACHKPASGSLPCYTFGSMYRETQDVRVARRVAEICDQPYQVISAGQEFLSRFPYYAERAVYLSDGCADVGRAPDLYINDRAREIAPVRMTGLYGGEVLRRVIAFKAAAPEPGLFDPEIVRQSQRAEATYAGLFEGHPVSFAVFRQAPWHQYGTLSVEETQVSMRSPYLDNDLVKTVFQSPEMALASDGISLRLIAEGNAELRRLRTDRGLMANSAQRGFWELLFKAEYAFDAGMPQWLARMNHASRFLQLERAFVGRHKPFHFRAWYRDSLAEYVREILLDARALSRPYVSMQGVAAIVQGHLKGHRNHTREIHTLLTLELLHRLFLDRVPEASGNPVEEAEFIGSERQS
jgi:asparagine synthase (glutamine-hydrolysing)